MIDHRRMPIPFQRQSQAAFDHWQLFASSASATRAQCAWALAEATVWPILPDFLLLPLALANPRRSYVPLGAAILGMATGGIATYRFASAYPAQARRLLQRLPTIQESNIAEVQRLLEAHGASAFWLQPYSGIPYKVWGVAAGAIHMPARRVLPTAIVARSLRMSVVVMVTSLLATRYVVIIRDSFLFLVVGYLGTFFTVWRRLLK